AHRSFRDGPCRPPTPFRRARADHADPADPARCRGDRLRARAPRTARLLARSAPAGAEPARMSEAGFTDRVYDMVRRVPRGRVVVGRGAGGRRRGAGAPGGRAGRWAGGGGGGAAGGGRGPGGGAGRWGRRPGGGGGRRPRRGRGEDPAAPTTPSTTARKRVRR